MKKANIAIISKSPEKFWNYYEPYMGKGYLVFNEIILHGLKYLPSDYSNQIICYIGNDLDKNIFDYTSGEEDELELAKDVLRIHGEKCKKEQLGCLEEVICNYISPRAVEWYQNRIEWNKTKQSKHVYWSFWGDLQYELLSCLPKERISKKSKDLLKVLSRRFYKVQLCYSHRDGHSGWVKSPVSGKNIGKNQWLQIITNSKLRDRNGCNCVEVKGGFLESSIKMFAGDFQSEVRKNPSEMIQFILDYKEKVLPVFVDSLFSGLLTSECLNEVNSKLIDKMFGAFPCDLKTYRASYFCGIIEKMHSVVWSAEVFNKLKIIALEYENPAVRFAILYALWPSYNIDQEWAQNKIIKIYESDIRTTSFYDSKNVLFRLYPKYKERVLKIIEKCFNDLHKEVIVVGGHAVCEFYIQYGKFDYIMFNPRALNEEQIKAILEMASLYLEIGDYRESAKAIILRFINSNLDLEFPLSRIFNKEYIKLEEDKMFLQEIVGSKAGKKIVWSFINYLEKNALSIVDYADIIIKLCENILWMEMEELRNQWGIEDEFSKLIISLYDETANSTKETNKEIAGKCLELWDIMFERQLGSVREISSKLMER